MVKCRDIQILYVEVKQVYTTPINQSQKQFSSETEAFVFALSQNYNIIANSLNIIPSFKVQFTIESVHRNRNRETYSSDYISEN